MFDIGFSELFLIAVVALVVLGPEKLPRAARFAGLWVRKARAQWYAVKSEFENDLAADELKRSLAETRESLRQAEEQLRTSVTDIREGVEKRFDEVAKATTAGVEPGAGTAPDAYQSDASQSGASADEAATDASGTDARGELDRPHEEERSLESAKHMDWEPPLPSDEDAGEDEVLPGSHDDDVHDDARARR